MSTLDEERKKINEIDEQMAHLFVLRFKACKNIAAWKKESGKAIYDPDREKEVIKKNLEYIDEEDLKKYYERFQQYMMDLSKEYQKEVNGG